MKGTQTKSIIPYLKNGRHTEEEITEKSGLKRFAVHNDLHTLLNIGIIKREKIDKTYYYFISEEELRRKDIDIDDVYHEVGEK